MARYYPDETVQVDDQNNDIDKNMRKSLPIIRATNYHARKLIITFDKSGLHYNALKSRNINRAGQKKSFSYIDILLPPTRKRTCLSASTKDRSNPTM